MIPPRLSEEDFKFVDLIEQYFIRISSPGDLIEIRAFPDESTGRTGVSRGLFSSLRKAALTAMHMANAGLHTYYTLNPILPDCFYTKYQQINRPEWWVRYTARDHNIARRRLYLFDLDAHFGKGCATDQEKAQAWESAQSLKQYLVGLGWPDPITIDSGNGYHLIYRADGCSVVQWATDELEVVLKFLKGKFPDLDAANFNPSRVARVPHTVNRRGPDTAERPHRRARILNYPDAFMPVTMSHVYRLGKLAGVRTDDDGRALSSRRAKRENYLLIDEAGVEELIDQYPDQLALGDITYEGNVTYFPLVFCPFKGAEHRDQNVGKGKTAIILRPNSIGFNCFSDDCSHYTFVDLLRLLHRETGRWPDTPIWKQEDLEALAARWGCPIEDASLPPGIEP
jgi:hypothetical protein